MTSTAVDSSANSPQDVRRSKVANAAFDYLTSADLEWERLLTFDRLEEVTGVDRAQIAKDFGGRPLTLPVRARFIV